jgi:hypothetical protein
MNKFFSLFIILLFCFLSACNGSAEKNDSAPEPPVISQLVVSTLNDLGESQQSFEIDQVMTLSARVLDQYSQPISGTRVNFTLDLGESNAPSALTNSDGIAAIFISNAENTLSAGTATVSIADLSQSVDYEFTDSVGNNLPDILSLKIWQDATETSQFKSDENVIVQATLTNSAGQAIEGQLVTFTTSLGLLSPAVSRTDTNGLATASLSGNNVLGGGLLTVSLQDINTVSATTTFQIIATDIVNDDIKLGHFNDDGLFIEGKIKLSIDNNTISAGGSLGLTVDLVDANNVKISTQNQVNFTSVCVVNDKASIDSQVLSIRGQAKATYEDISCAGISGSSDEITASIIVNNVTKYASEIVTITGEDLGSISFVSAEPTILAIKGTGGQETSTLTFQLKSKLDNPLGQQQVDFTLDNIIGGISLSRSSGLTNSQGLITTQVIAGTAPTVVRVTAQATMNNNGDVTTVQTQSSELSINTGLPEQASMTIAASILNPEANIRGTTSTITVWLADNFNNPVPDATSVNFTTEGGTIEPNCTTVNGSCSVVWTATEPYLEDHRATILMTAVGHESFFDTNGNNLFDDDDVSMATDDPSYINAISSGFMGINPQESGFIDMQEAWRDDNENNNKDSNENIFYDSNGDGIHSPADGKFNGPQCQGTYCDSQAKTSILRRAIVLIMADARNPIYTLADGTTGDVYNNYLGEDNPVPDIDVGASQDFTFSFADSQLQALPIDSSVTISIDDADLQGNVNYTQPNTNVAGLKTLNFIVSNPVDNEVAEAFLNITIDSAVLGNIITISKKITFLVP